MSNQRISSKANSRARARRVSPRAARHPRQAHIRDRTAAPCRGAGGAAIRRSWRAAPRGCGFCRATCRPRPCVPSHSMPRHSQVNLGQAHIGVVHRFVVERRTVIVPEVFTVAETRCGPILGIVHQILAATAFPHLGHTVAERAARAPSPTGRGADPGSRKDCPSPFRSNCASGSIRHKAPVPRSRKGIYRHS